MAIILTLRKQEFQLDGTTIQVKAALQKLNLSPEAHLLVRDGELLNENDYLKDGDRVKIVAVISGGCLGSGRAAILRLLRKRGCRTSPPIMEDGGQGCPPYLNAPANTELLISGISFSLDSENNGNTGEGSQCQA